MHEMWILMGTNNLSASGRFEIITKTRQTWKAIIAIRHVIIKRGQRILRYLYAKAQQ